MRYIGGTGNVLQVRYIDDTANVPKVVYHEKYWWHRYCSKRGVLAR